MLEINITVRRRASKWSENSCPRTQQRNISIIKNKGGVENG